MKEDQVDKKKIIEFLSKQKVISIATSVNQKPWISNFYYKVVDNFEIYFLTVKDNEYSRKAFENNLVAFNIYYHGDDLYADRESVQGVGLVSKIKSSDFPKVADIFRERIEGVTSMNIEDWFKKNKNSIGMWVIKPDFIKYLNDKEYGKNEYKNINIYYK